MIVAWSQDYQNNSLMPIESVTPENSIKVVTPIYYLINTCLLSNAENTVFRYLIPFTPKEDSGNHNCKMGWKRKGKFQ